MNIFTMKIKVNILRSFWLMKKNKEVLEEYDEIWNKIICRVMLNNFSSENYGDWYIEKGFKSNEN